MALLEGMKRSREPEDFLNNDGEELVRVGLEGEPRRRLGDEPRLEVDASLAGVEKNPFSFNTEDMGVAISNPHARVWACWSL
jgi:hypothetical protein